MDGVYCTENLQAETERGGKRESATRLGPAEFGQIFALQLDRKSTRLNSSH